MAVMTRSQYEDFTHLRNGYASIPEGTLAALRQTAYPVGTPGEMTYNEPDTGYRDEIGLRALASQTWAISRDSRARTYMLLNADCSAYFPIHRYVTGQTNDGPVKPWVYGAGDAPGFTLDTINFPNQNTSINVDMAHKPQFLFDSCVLMFQEGNTTQANIYLTEMKYHVSWNFFNSPSSARNGVKGIYNPHASANQPRGCAWAFRDLAMLCFVLQHYAPADEWYSWVKTSVEENVKFYNGCYNPVAPNYDTSAFTPYYSFPLGAFKNYLGITQGANFAYGPATNGASAVIAPWMQGFMGSAFILGQLMGLELSSDGLNQYIQLASFMARFVAILWGAPNDSTAYDYRRCGQYNLIIGTVPATGDAYSGVNYCQNPAALFAANAGPIFPATTLPNPDDHVIRDTSSDSPSAFSGRYDDNLGPHLAMAVDFNTASGGGAYGVNESFNRLWHSQGAAGGSIPFNYLPKGYNNGASAADLPASTGTPMNFPATSTAAPTTAPSGGPTAAPTTPVTSSPTTAPTAPPTSAPTAMPTTPPSVSPSSAPGFVPYAWVLLADQGSGASWVSVGGPDATPTAAPTSAPTLAPTTLPTAAPTSAPTGIPTSLPTSGPTSTPTSSIEVIPVPNTQLRSQYGEPFILTGATTMDGLSTSAIAYVGRIVNSNSELDFAVQIYAPTIPALGLKVLSVYVGSGPDADHMPEGLDIGNLVKIGEVGMVGGGWSALLSIAKTLNLMPPVVDIYVRNDCGRPLASSGHQAIVLPTSARWIAA